MKFVVCLNCGKTMPKQETGIEFLDKLEPKAVWCSQSCLDEWEEKRKNESDTRANR